MHGSKRSVPSKSDIQELHADVSFPHSGAGVSLPNSGSKDIQEEKTESEYGSYGNHYEEITEEHLKQIALELGLIKLYWPQELIPDVDQRKHYPPSYTQNSNKEKLLLWYSENFRRQYHFVYKARKPLFLAAKNECGLQKMVCTTVRPTTIRLPEFRTWEGCANFVADHLNYKPLEKPQLLPGRLFSPTAVMERQKGNIFEYSTLLCSFLIGSGYDAYVVSGCATREFCVFDQTRVVCPCLPEFTKAEKRNVDKDVPKYAIKPPANLYSEFLLEMEAKKVRKKEEEEKKREEAMRLVIEEFEKPPPDEISGTRVHSWVVVLPTCINVQEPFFIDPLTGNKCDLSNPNFLRLESIWNHTNYWVNLQSCSERCKNLKFQLTDLKCWEHLLPGEPWHFWKSGHDEGNVTADTILEEKHLDMPASWVDRLEISNAVYEKRFPNGHKTVLYKKCKLEKFAPYVQEDGLVTRITTYTDYDWTVPELVYEYYSNRVDCLLQVRSNMLNRSIVEVFRRGRADCLREHSFFLGRTGVEDKRTMVFYHMARHDGLEKLEMDPLYLIQHFHDRLDLLYYRKVDYQPGGQGQVGGSKRNVLKLVEEFCRNPKKDANSDIARRTFAVADNQILLKFHCAPGKITAATREFIKPPLTEMAEKLTFNPDLTAGYQTNPTDHPPKNLYLFCMLREQLKAEEDSLLSARQMEEEDKQIRAQAARELETDVDFLAPYFARIGNPEKISEQQALQIREDCIADFKQLFVDRINKIQDYFEEVGGEIQAKNKWYEEERDNLTKAEEDAYLKANAEKSFLLHVLEVRLARLRHLATARYQTIEALFRADKRLSVLYG
ncbi:dynein regulatory complex subunit 7 isoform X2 [Cryptotermes secundus]|uniref:dynein regulatory complex subunit 7 isoform X2 n=1 Tax=Cryptotermes secundus TaxID=105785 RepID=UPI000CD7D607|nr:dynein regulatory complex subunit 7 isoform X2 [Cryptotermes secundus]